MFFKKVYKYNKLLFVLMMVFIIGQLFINYKHGMVFSPFYHYGMYSEVMVEKKAYKVFEVEVNGEKLKAQDFSPQQWDNIILPVNYYTSINKSNALYFSDVSRLMNAVHVQPNEQNYLQQCDTVNFKTWYKSYLTSLLKMHVKTLTVQYRMYEFVNGHLQPTNSVQSISTLWN